MVEHRGSDAERLTESHKGITLFVIFFCPVLRPLTTPLPFSGVWHLVGMLGPVLDQVAPPPIQAG